jgi:hypothetical protein
VAQGHNHRLRSPFLAEALLLPDRDTAPSFENYHEVGVGEVVVCDWRCSRYLPLTAFPGWSISNRKGSDSAVRAGGVFDDATNAKYQSCIQPA